MKFLSAFAALALTLSANATTGAEVLKALLDYRTDLYVKAQDQFRKDKKPIDSTKILSEVRAKALASLKPVVLDKVDAKEALDYAQVCQMAGLSKDAISLVRTYIAAKPAPDLLYEAQKLLIAASFETRDDATIVETLGSMKPVGDVAALDYLALSLAIVERENKSLGLDKSIQAIDRGLDSLNPATLNKGLAQRYQTVRAQAILLKVDLCRQGSKPDQALKAIEGAMIAGPDSLAKRLAVLKNQLSIVGTDGPTLKVAHLYGQFDGFAPLKGKVIVLYFFAHWLRTFDASLAESVKMAKELSDRGLVVVGVTQTYGRLKDINKPVSTEKELSAMSDLFKERHIDWPIVFGGRDNFVNYGVSDLPTFVVVDRRGTVRLFHSGFGPSDFGEFRKALDALLQER